jgi:hypothetical protein
LTATTIRSEVLKISLALTPKSNEKSKRQFFAGIMVAKIGAFKEFSQPKLRASGRKTLPTFLPSERLRVRIETLNFGFNLFW